MKSLLLCLIFSTFFLQSCSTNNISDYPKLSDAIRENYSKNNIDKITNLNTKVPNLSSRYKYMAPGHRFKISHPSDSKLSGVFRVNKSGKLFLPYNVSISVKNKTFSVVKNEILNAYSKFFEDGVGSVSVSLYSRQYYVELRGLVKKPGTYLVNYKDSLDMVISKAGGLVGNIVQEYFTADMQQTGEKYQVLLNNYYDSSKKSEQIYWTGFDSIFVSKLDALASKNSAVPFVTVLGGVSKPGKVLFEKDATLFYFLNKSGGTIPGLDYEECYVFRVTNDGLQKVAFRFDEPESIPVIYPNDIIYFNTQVQQKTDKILSRLVQIGSLLSTIALLILAL
jgi:protein involved in polysaccharide export with SLBB domain